MKTQKLLKCAVVAMIVFSFASYCSNKDETMDYEMDDRYIEDRTLNINMGNSSIILEPQGMHSLESKRTGEFNEHDIMHAVRGIIRSEEFETTKTKLEGLKAENASYSIQIDPEKHSFHIRVKGDIYIPKGETATLEDEAYLEKARKLLKALGATHDEIKAYSKDIVAFNRDNPFEEIECIPQTKGYHIDRFIGGIRVATNSIIISFRLDGSLLSITGRWTPVNYSNSQLSSEVTQSRMVELAVEKLESENVDLDSDHEITLGTFYQPVKNGIGEWILDLMGFAIVKHMDTDGRVIDSEGYEFDI